MLDNLRHAARILGKESDFDKILNEASKSQAIYTHPKFNEVLLIETKGGMERRIVHEWAVDHSYQHCSIITDKFDTNLIYKCPECFKFFYANDMVDDYQDNESGYCQDCKKYYNVKELKGKICFNAVMVGQYLPFLSKRETRIKSKKSTHNKKTFRNFPDNRKILRMSYREFGSSLYLNDQYYQRNLNKNQRLK